MAEQAKWLDRTVESVRHFAHAPRRRPEVIASGERAARAALPQILEAIQALKPLDAGNPLLPDS